MSISLVDSVSVASTVGDQTTLSARLSVQEADVDRENNLFISSQNIVGAIDPNHLTVAPEGEGLGGYIEKGEMLRYTVHFENKGSYSASHVVVDNDLPDGLDVSHLQILASSHDYEFEIVDQHQLRIYFRNIELADSSNPEANKGFLQYLVPTTEQVVEGQMITNQARITFDYEDPLQTNTTLNTIKESRGSGRLSILPNPCRSIAKVVINDEDPKFYNRTITSYTIKTIDGRLVKQERISSPELFLACEQLRSGTYIVSVVDTEGIELSNRLVVE